MMDELAAAIARVVAGDLNCLSRVLSASHPAIQEATARLPRLVVSPSALAKVLKDWSLGLFSAEHVQKWASFVRRGYISGGASGQVRPIQVDYDSKNEELIVEILGRLDELGDQVDGQIGTSELEEMLQALLAVDPSQDA
jgi:hypothetical protein